MSSRTVTSHHQVFKDHVHSLQLTDKAHMRPSRRTFFCSLCACDLTTGPNMMPPPRLCTTVPLLSARA